MLLNAFMQITPFLGAEDLPLWSKLAVAIGIGILIGLEREFSQKGETTENVERFAGIRTFPIISLLGFLCAFLAEASNPWILPAAILGIFALVTTSYIVSYQQRRSGSTTQFTAILTFLLGALLQFGYLDLSLLIAVATTILLALKLKLHSWVRTFSQQDIYAILEFVVLTVLVLPVLPDKTYGPYDVLNPHDIWVIVIILLTLNFTAYLVNKFIGEQKGTVVSGVLGGFASSTAVSWFYSRRSKAEPGKERTQSAAVVLASSIMFPRVLFWLYLLNKELLREMALPVIILGLAGGAMAWWLLKKENADQRASEERSMKNPLNLGDALTFGVLYAGILLLVAYARDNLGEEGVYIASGISGLADIDAITISMSKLTGKEMVAFVTHNAIILAALANTLVKYGLCLGFGSKDMRRFSSYGFLPILGVGTIYLGIRMLL